MKFLAKLKLKNITSNVLKTTGKVIDNTFLGGAVQATNEENATPKGKPDWGKIILQFVTISIPLIVLLWLLFGPGEIADKIDQAKAILDLF